MPVIWKPEPWMNDFERDSARRLNEAGRLVAAEAKRLIREPKHGTPPPHRVLSTRTVKVAGKPTVTRDVWKLKKGGAPTPYRYEWVVPRSAPGEPPAWQTGTLGRSVFHAMLDQRTCIVGVPSLSHRKVRVPKGSGKGKGKTTMNRPADPRYGLYLEIGRGRMQARPYLRPALANMQEQIQEIYRRPRP